MDTEGNTLSVRRERDISVDVAKGIAILLVIVGHTEGWWVSTFHMPFFYMLSGLFLSDKLPMKEYTRHRARQLLVPYLLGVLFTILGVAVKDIVFSNAGTIPGDALKWLLAGLYGKGTNKNILIPGITKIGAYWFLLGMFWGSLIARKFVDQKLYPAILAVIAYLGWATRQQVFLPWSIQNGMVAAFFIGVGVLVSRYKLLEKKADPAVIIGCSLLWIFAVANHMSLSIVNVNFPNGLFDVIVALGTSYVVMKLSQGIAEKSAPVSNVLSFLGRNTIVIYFWHAWEINVLNWNWLMQLMGTDKTSLAFLVVKYIIRVIFVMCMTKITLNIKPLHIILTGKKPA